MIIEPIVMFWFFCICVIMLFLIGLYCIFVTYNLVRALIGLEILIKAVTLLIIVVGYVSDHLALAQSFVITLIVIEVVFITVAAGVVIGLRRHNQSLDVRKIRELRG